MGRWFSLVLLGATLVAGPAAAQREPALRLSGAGRVAAVVDNLVRDGFDQRIRYDGGDGRNYGDISVRYRSGGLLLAFPLRLARPTRLGIASELATSFPGESMRILAPRRNAYGPVGVALGRDCLYAWQWLESRLPRQDLDAGDRLFPYDSRTSTARRAVSIRIRLCRTERTPPAGLLRAVETMRIVIPGVARPSTYGAGRTYRRVERTRRSSGRPSTRPRDPAATPTPAPEAPQAPPSVFVPSPQTVPEGRRYLGPVPSQGSPGVGTTPQPDVSVPRPGDAPRPPTSRPGGPLPGGVLPPEAYTPR